MSSILNWVLEKDQCKKQIQENSFIKQTLLKVLFYNLKKAHTISKKKFSVLIWAKETHLVMFWIQESSIWAIKTNLELKVQLAIYKKWLTIFIQFGFYAYSRTKKLSSSI